MIWRALASAWLVAKHQASFMSLAWTQTTAPTSRPPAVTEAAEILRARPPLPTQSAARRVSPSAAATWILPRNPDDIVKAQFVEKGEQLDVAEAAIGQDRDDGALGQRLGEAEQTEVFIVVALRARQETTKSGARWGNSQVWDRILCAGMLDVALIRERFEALSPHLDERGRRLFAATEAAAAGYGGIAAVSRITGIAASTIGRGLNELAAPTRLEPGRIRRSGGGRKALVVTDRKLLDDLNGLVEPEARGDPMSPLRWTCRRVCAESRPNSPPWGIA